MAKKLKNRIKGLLKSKGGFTLIELIIVIAIMGFLAAMVAPRLAGVAGGAGVAVCDVNQQRLVQVTGSFYENVGHMPNGLTNLIVKNDTGVVQDPHTATAWMVDNDNKADGMEIFASDLWAAARMRPHVLDAAEVKELAELGITNVYDLNLNKDVTTYNGKDMKWNTNVPAAGTGNTFMDPHPLATGNTVMMVGGTPGDAVTSFAHMPAGTGTIGHPDKIYRIMMGVGPDSQLVKDGYISNTALCPNAIKRGDHFAYKHYTVALPRLQATVDRIVATNVHKINVTDANTGAKRTFNLEEVMQPFQFDVFCPEGDVIIDRVLEWKVDAAGLVAKP